MMKEIVRSDEEIKNTIAENYENDTKIAMELNKRSRDLWEEMLTMTDEAKLQTIFAIRRTSAGKPDWNLQDISNVCLIYDIDAVKRLNVEFDTYYFKTNLAICLKWQQVIKKLALDLIRSAVNHRILTRDENVFINGKNFGDCPEDTVEALAFKKLVERELRICGDIFSLRIHPHVIEIMKRREKIEEAEKKSDGEIVLVYLKSKFIEDILNGVSKEKLLNKFTSEGILVSTGTQKHYKYTIDGREIRISKERLGYIASILLDPDVKVTKKAA